MKHLSDVSRPSLKIMEVRQTAMLFFVLTMWTFCRGNLCQDNTVFTFEEGSAGSLTCATPDVDTTVVDWWMIPIGAVNKTAIGTCFLPDKNDPCVTYSNDLDLHKGHGGRLPVTFLTVRRNLKSAIAGTVECAGFRRTGTQANGDPLYEQTSQQRCAVRVKYPADRVLWCSLQWSSEDWTVSGHCDLARAYPGDTGYTCLWVHMASNVKIWQQGMHTTAGPAQDSLRCSFYGSPLSPTLAPTVFSLYINRRGGGWIPVTRIHTEKPGPPKLNSCPTHIIEGSYLTCLCHPPSPSSSSSIPPGSPPPLVTWIPGQIQPLLRIPNVSRGSDNSSFTCYQGWGGWGGGRLQTVVYTVRVYYSPEAPYFLHADENTVTVTANQSFNLQCRTKGGNPEIHQDSIRISCPDELKDKDEDKDEEKSSEEKDEETSSGREKPSGKVRRMEDGSWIATFTFSGRVASRDHMQMLCKCSVTTFTPEGHRFYQEGTVKVVMVGENDEEIEESTTGLSMSSAAIIDKSNNKENGDDDDDDDDDESSSTGSLAGAIVGVLLLFIIIAVVIIVVVVVIRRRRKVLEKTHDRLAEDGEIVLEEHINDMYVSADEYPSDPMSRGSLVTNQNEDAGLYSTADEDDGDWVLTSSGNDDDDSRNDCASVKPHSRHLYENGGSHTHVEGPETESNVLDNMYAQVEINSNGSHSEFLQESEMQVAAYAHVRKQKGMTSSENNMNAAPAAESVLTPGDEIRGRDANNRF